MGPKWPCGRAMVLTLLLALFGAPVTAQQPPEPQGSFVTVNGHQLWYRIVGKGQPLLVIPGGPGTSHTYLYPGLERLADAFQVIFFDAYGRGKSARAKTPSEYSFDRDIEEIEGLRKALNLGKIAVYGQSYGGVVAQAYALRYPQALTKLILANTLHGAEMWQKGNDNWNREIQNQFPEIWSELQQLRAKGMLTKDPEYLKALDRVPWTLLYFYSPAHSEVPFELNFEVYNRIAGPDADVMLGGDLASVDFRRKLRDIQIPTLVLAGRFDRMALPRYSVQYRTLMPQAEFVMFEQSGHFPFIEEPERHDSVVRAFLGK